MLLLSTEALLCLSWRSKVYYVRLDKRKTNRLHQSEILIKLSLKFKRQTWAAHSLGIISLVICSLNVCHQGNTGCLS